MQRSPSAKSPLPVICIGNFTAGGTGKTPLALLVADRLIQRGFTPVFLTRGYGSRVRGPTLVDPTRHGAADVGDEALLLARAACVMVAPDRTAGARAIVEQCLDASLIIMDDGLQNPSLAKDLRIAVVDGARGFGNGLVIPAGPMRAPLGVQLAHTDIVVVNGRRDDRDGIARAIAPAFAGPVLSAHQAPAGDCQLANWYACRCVRRNWQSAALLQTAAAAGGTSCPGTQLRRSPCLHRWRSGRSLGRRAAAWGDTGHH